MPGLSLRIGGLQQFLLNRFLALVGQGKQLSTVVQIRFVKLCLLQWAQIKIFKEELAFNFLLGKKGEEILIPQP